MNLNDLSEADITQRLGVPALGEPQNPYPFNYFNRPRRRAAVLIPFTCKSDSWQLLFIRRTQNERDHHGGQVAFPGGAMDPTDPDIRATALREAQEEVGLRPADVRVLGQLDDVITITNFHVTPVVGVFDQPYDYLAQPGEVARIFSIPLAWLADPNNHEVRFRQVDPYEPWPVIYFNEYDGELLWGFTAALTLQLLKTLA